MTFLSKSLKAILIASSPLIISAQPVMAQGMPDATFADGCNGSATSVLGTIQDFLNFSKDGVNGCQVKDKLYTFLPGAFADFDLENTTLQISNPAFNPLSHNIKLSNGNGFQPGPYDFNYTISVINSPNLYIKEWFSSAEPLDSDFSDYQLVTDTNLTLSSTIVFPPTAATSRRSFPIGTQSVDFTNLLTVKPGFAGPSGFTNTVIQAESIKTVPGPLPLLGAAAAFGFSRKLRARIKAMA
jgi:hypothetical protein